MVRLWARLLPLTQPPVCQKKENRAASPKVNVSIHARKAAVTSKKRVADRLVSAHIRPSDPLFWGACLLETDSSISARFIDFL